MKRALDRARMNKIVHPQDFTIETATGPDPAPLAWLPQLLGFLRRRWPTILATTLALLALGAGYLLFATPKYTATASVLVDTRRADMYRQQAVISADAQYENAMVESQAEILQSEPIAKQVVRRLKLDQDEQFLSWGGGVMATVSRLVGGLFESRVAAVPAGSAEERQVANAAEILGRLTAIRRVGLSYVIAVSVRTPDPARSAQLANAVVQALIETQLESKYDTIRRASGWLEVRLKELREQSLAADRAVQEFKAQNGIVDTEKGLMDEHQLADLGSQLVQARTRAADAAAKLARVQQIKDGNLTDALVSDALQSLVITKLRQDYLDAARREADWSARYGANHGAAVNLRNQMREIQNSIRAELDRIAGAYRSDYEVAKENEAGVQRRLDELIATASATNSERVRLRSLESMAEAYRSIQTAFLQRYTQAAQDQSFPISEARVVADATPPLRKSWPQPLLVLLAAGVGGVILGGALAFAREVMDRGLRTPAQVRAAIGLDCVSVLPELGRRELAARAGRGAAATAGRRHHRQAEAAGSTGLGGSGGGSTAVRAVAAPSDRAMRWVLDAPFSPFTEAMRGIRARVLQRRGRGRGDARVIACTSATSGEGKSTVAANLAFLMAGAGQRTLLMDWDLRQQTLSRALAPDARTGFHEIVRGSSGGAATAAAQSASGDVRAATAAPSPGAGTPAGAVLGGNGDAGVPVAAASLQAAVAGPIVWQDPGTGLRFLPAGGAGAPIPGVDLLGSERTRTLMAAVRGEYDCIVLDLPPLDATADAHAVSDLVDGFLMVVEWGRTSQDAVLDLLARADLEPQRMLGVVLNKADPRAASKLFSYYAGAYGRAYGSRIAVGA